MLAAQCQGVSPALLLASTLAPSCSSSVAPSAQPWKAAQCSGVTPAASTSLTSVAPPSTSVSSAVVGCFSLFCLGEGGMGGFEQQRLEQRQNTKKHKHKTTNTPLLSRLCTARCSSIGPTRPQPRTLPPPPGLTPTGPW